MVRGGISSVSYRNTAAEAVIAAALQAGLAGIEWSADTHAPPGDLERAETLMMATLRARLTVSAYGSFYRLDGDLATEALLKFKAILESARRLQAPSIRIWAGSSPGPALSALARDLADQAGDLGITICLEPHARSVIADYPALAAFIKEVDHPFFKACWTPLPENPDRTLCLEELIPHIQLVHVRHWTKSYARLSLQEKAPCVGIILSALAKRAQTAQLDFWALIEYLQDDSPETLSRESAALTELLDRYA